MRTRYQRLVFKHKAEIVLAAGGEGHEARDLRQRFLCPPLREKVRSFKPWELDFVATRKGVGIESTDSCENVNHC